MLAMRPEILDRIEFWRIRWKEFGHQATALGTDELLSQPAAMRRQAIPDQEQLAGDMAE